MRIKIYLAVVLAFFVTARIAFAEDKGESGERLLDVGLPAPESEPSVNDQPVVTKTFILEYVRPEDIMARVRKQLSPARGQAFYDPEKNSLFVSDTADYIEKISQLVKELDKRLDIPIEWRVVQIFLNEEHNNGLDWEAIVSNYQSFDVYGEKSDSPPQELRLSVGTITKEDLPVLLDALGAAGRSQEVKRESGLLTVNRTIAGGVEYWETPLDLAQKKGFMFKAVMTPHLTEEKELSIELVPELGWYPFTVGESESARVTGFSPTPKLNIKVEDDEVIVIGGLIHYIVGERTDKVPIFGDLPLVGPFFRSQNPTKQGTEYIILLVPGNFKPTVKKAVQ